MKPRILLTGYDGYLGTHIRTSKQFQEYEFIQFIGDVREIKNWENYKSFRFRYIFHAGSPAGIENYSNEFIKTSIITGTKNAVALSNKLDCPLINFSTRGIYNVSNVYEKTKKVSYVEVIHSCNKFINLIIPRVYSKDRTKGLISKLDNIHKDLDKEIQYITIEDFLDRLYKVFWLDKEEYFFPFRSNTIQELKTLFKN